MNSPTPFQQMQAEKAAARAQGRPVTLNDYQREQRRKANTLAQRRAMAVLKERHKAEFLSLATAERHALYALIDQEAASGGTTPIYDLTGGR